MASVIRCGGCNRYGPLEQYRSRGAAVMRAIEQLGWDAPQKQLAHIAGLRGGSFWRVFNGLRKLHGR
jgi:hypothetical protein